MLPALESLTSAASALLLTVSSACQPPQPPFLSVNFQNSPPTQSHTLNHQQLGSFKSSTLFSHGHDEVFVTGGITESNINTSYDLRFRRSFNPSTGQACVWVESLKIDIAYSPKIHIASNYKRESCRFSTTLQHEARHVNTDIITIKEYLPRVEDEVRKALAAKAVAGPVSQAGVESEQAALSEYVSKTLKAATGKMNDTRMKRQQQIDTRQEYLRLSKACPGE